MSSSSVRRCRSSGGPCSRTRRASRAWRIAAWGRDEVVDRERAEKAVKHDDQVKRAWVNMLHHVEIDDPSRFSVVLDASRLSPDRVVETLLSAAGVER